MKWIKLSIIVFFTNIAGAQTGLELRYLQNDGLALGVDDNNFTRVDYKKAGHTIGLSNTVNFTSVKKQFVDLSYLKEFKIGELRLLPCLSFSSNLRTDDLNISTVYFELPMLYTFDKVMLLLKPGYDLQNEAFVSVALSYQLSEELQLLFSYGKMQSFNTGYKAMATALVYSKNNISLKSGLELPQADNNQTLRLLTSFLYTIRHKGE